MTVRPNRDVDVSEGVGSDALPFLDARRRLPRARAVPSPDPSPTRREGRHWLTSW